MPDEQVPQIEETPDAPDQAAPDGTPADTAASEVNWEVAWAAGLFEGEGCVSLSQTNGRSFIQLSLASTDLDVLDRFARAVGVGRVYTKRSRLPHHKPIWQWRTARRGEVDHVRSLLLSFLGERRTAKWRECDERKSKPIRSERKWSVRKEPQYV